VIPGFRGTLSLAQLIGFFGGSGGTHANGGAGDYWLFGKMADLVTAEARKAGADPTWHRPAGWDGPGSDEHVHSVLRGCPHLSESAQAQVWAVDHNGDGLVGTLPDPGPRPLSGRTWEQGIEWMEEQEMMDYEALLAQVIKQGEQAKRRDVAMRGLVKNLAEMLGDLGDALGAEHEALKRRITKAKNEVLAAKDSVE
jgi:hypothetical protein